ncbi:hypothetical protein GCM10009801_34790 [Streptomyces albiaxialis]|uniref:ABC transporter permease n=1 Tax=Streptomyces albiaxialis TaxID=329523 RepID=A0ABN2W316_9ACTN
MSVPTPSSHNQDPSQPAAPPQGAAGPVPPPVAEWTPGPNDEGGASAGREVRDAVLYGLGVAVVGVVFALLWVWMAPKVPLFTDGKAVYLKDPEGEEAFGSDGSFLLIGVVIGVVTGALVFYSRRIGGVGLAVGLGLGALAGSFLAWRLGVWLGPESDMAVAAKEAGKGATFDAPMKLQAKGVLLAWPLAALVTHLALTVVQWLRDAGAAPLGPPPPPPPVEKS